MKFRLTFVPPTCPPETSPQQQLPVSAENAEHLAPSPPPPSRPNLWPTPFVPAVEQSWRRRRPRSQPIGAETAERVRAVLEGGGAATATEEFWTSAMRELADWAYDPPPPLLEEPHGERAQPYIDVDQIERAWAMPNTSTREMSPSVRRDVLEGRSDGERPETGWAEEESRWGSNQWTNVLNMATTAMREPDRRLMLDEEYRQERWEMQRQWGSRRVLSQAVGVRAIGRARDFQRRGDEAERTQCQQWEADFAEFMASEYIN
ncbi:hypothetical protein DFH09DRAFT_1332373 [Mycena vulgaris]|nr:hypothetical protein DFH09DRAFT_1332373 [Mycena vulgaris]